MGGDRTMHEGADNYVYIGVHNYAIKASMKYMELATVCVCYRGHRSSQTSTTSD